MSGKDGKPVTTGSSSVMAVIFAMSFYISVSISLVFANKYVMTGDQLDAPLFLTWTQLVVAVICCYVLSNLKKVVSLFSFFPEFEYDLKKAKGVLPLSFIFVGMIVCNNLCLKYVEVSFYQVARSLTILCNIALTFLVLGQKTSMLALIGCAIVVSGFLVGTVAEVKEINASVRGVVFGVASSVFVALYAIYVKKVLPVVNNNTWLLMIYNNINAGLIMPVCFVLMGEWTPIVESDVLFQQNYLGYIFAAGMLGFFINIATFLQIKVTSPLTHNVVGTFKACVQTVFAVHYYQNMTTWWFWSGFFLTVLGSAVYTYARFQKM